MKKIFMLIFIAVQTGCAFMLTYIKDKKASVHETEFAMNANKIMWNNFHLGNYDSIPVILAKLNEAYQLDPNDAKVAAHLGFTYLWAFSERIRKVPDERILENIFLSNRFFKEAIILNPHDPRLKGFQSATAMCEGALTNNLEILATAYFSSRRAIKSWSQFNKFALGYVESQLDTGSRMFRQGLSYQWQIIDECSKSKLNEKVVRADPKRIFTELFTEIENSTDPAIKRACGNSWIAPHNWEGFFLNFGDMLVKADQLETAKMIYAAAKISPAYNQWVYKYLIDERINNVEENKVAFNRLLNLTHLRNEAVTMINSNISCVGCHQMSAAEFASAGYREPLKETYFLANNRR